MSTAWLRPGWFGGGVQPEVSWDFQVRT